MGMKKAFLFLFGLMLAGVGCVSQKSDLPEEFLEVSDLEIIDEIGDVESSSPDTSITGGRIDQVSLPAIGELDEENDDLSIAAFEVIAGDYFFKPENLMVSAG